MQITSKELYQKVALDNSISIEFVKFVGDAVFKEWNLNLKNPSKIILKLKKLGRMYIRRNKMMREIKKFDDCIECIRTEEMLNKHNLFKNRMVEYEEYISKRKEYKKIRYSQPIIEKIKEEWE